MMVAESERIVRLALAMAASDLRCAMPWQERIRLTRLLGSETPLDVTDWQRWGCMVLTWLWETRPTLARQVKEAVTIWRQEEALCPTRP